MGEDGIPIISRAGQMARLRAWGECTHGSEPFGRIQRTPAHIHSGEQEDVKVWRDWCQLHNANPEPGTS